MYVTRNEDRILTFLSTDYADSLTTLGSQCTQLTPVANRKRLNSRPA